MRSPGNTCAIGGINALDQWGVELGKQLAGRIIEDLRTGHASPAQDDAPTAGLIGALIRAGSAPGST